MFAPFLQIRINDVADILVVSVLVYMAMIWIRRTRAGFVAIGILLIGALYVAARALDLRLTAWIFQGFFAIFLVIIVVIFQEELRQLFERLAVWSLRRGKGTSDGFDWMDTLVKCLSDFARDRIGALVVIPGKQPIMRHVQGGVELDGVLSEPLLKSIFDPHSPGHDGAVIVESGGITRFATHLPLSKDFQQLAQIGTRHSAALGLAERTDALCLVVSEERGQVSIARDGRLLALNDVHVLGAELRRFLDEKHRAPNQRRSWRRFVAENWVEKLASLALVIALWYVFVPGSRPATLTYVVPVTVANLPADMQLDKVDPPDVQVSLTAPRRAFYLFDHSRLKVTVDAALAQFGRRTFDITESNVVYPRELTLDDISPSKVKISVTERPATSESVPGAQKTRSGQS